MKKNVAVFGAGLSGQSVAKLVKAEGHSFSLFDEKENGVNHLSKKELDFFDAYIFSPGFSKNHAWRKLLSAKDTVYGELGYASERWRGKIFAVTGTNGKTTVTRLLEAVFRASGKEAYVAGNIGIPLSELVNSEANHKDAIAICEISSFQAELTKGLSLDGLIWTNFAEDHLDRYENMDDYFKAKFALFGCLKENALVCISEALLEAKGPDFWSSYGIELVKVETELPESLSKSSVFQGYPHLLNYNLVSGFIKLLGMKEADLLTVANDFELDAHRLNKIYENGGLKIWEDSKSTNLHSVFGALRAMEGPVIWIGGGTSKNSDISQFAKTLSPLVDRVITFGAVGEALNGAFLKQGKRSVYYLKLEDAIRESVELAKGQEEQEGVNILFSPGFASYDQFTTYSERGNFFQKTIFSLLKESGCL